MPTDGMQNSNSDFSPDNWAKRRLKFIAYITTSTVDKHILEHEIPVKICNYTDVYYNEKITAGLLFAKGTVTDTELEKFGLKKGQVVLTKDSESWEDIAIPAYVAEVISKVVCGYHLAIIEQKNDELDGNFLYWLACSPELNDQFKLSAKGVTRFGLSQFALKNAIVKIPPLNYQRKVSTYLDNKTAEIDSLISKKKKLLDHLAEKRTAVITHAVTKGLNPDVPMKDSGIEWVGEIPEHWKVVQLRRTLSSLEQGWSPACEERHTVNDEWGVLKSGCVNGGVYRESEHKALTQDMAPKVNLLVEPGDILMCRASGSQHLIGSVAKVAQTTRKLMFSDKNYRLKVDETKISPQFLVRSMAAKYMRDQIILSISGAEGLANNIPQADVKSYLICLPPIIEQQQITSTIDIFDKDITCVENVLKQVIEKLNEYRSALITNAVTGKIKVA